MNGWQVLRVCLCYPNVSNVSGTGTSSYVRFVVVSGQSAFIANNRKADLPSASKPMAANEGVNMLLV